jgi:acyl carrier protein
MRRPSWRVTTTEWIDRGRTSVINIVGSGNWHVDLTGATLEAGDWAMTPENISNLVKRKTAEIIGNIDPAELDTAKSLRGYGVSSLDLVELVSVLMRELKIKVPRAELKKIGTIDELISVFQSAANLPVAH